MMTAKPIEVFRLGDKKVVVCQITGHSPHHFLDKELWLYSGGRRVGRIRFVGVSTASKDGEFDFSYSGDGIRPEQLQAGALISDGVYEDAVRSFEAA